tara:strand:+ start:222 stop:323 length:102 start_codon:yes stop_codon:yes gene_type:complete
MRMMPEEEGKEVETEEWKRRRCSSMKDNQAKRE